MPSVYDYLLLCFVLFPCVISHQTLSFSHLSAHVIYPGKKGYSPCCSWFAHFYLFLFYSRWASGLSRLFILLPNTFGWDSCASFTLHSIARTGVVCTQIRYSLHELFSSLPPCLSTSFFFDMRVTGSLLIQYPFSKGTLAIARSLTLTLVFNFPSFSSLSYQRIIA